MNVDSYTKRIQDIAKTEGLSFTEEDAREILLRMAEVLRELHNQQQPYD